MFLTLFQEAAGSRPMHSLSLWSFYTDNTKVGSGHSIAAWSRLLNTQILTVEISPQYFRSESCISLGLQMLTQ